MIVAVALKSARVRSAVAILAVAIAGTAPAQDKSKPTEPNSTQSLRLPEHPVIFGTEMPSVVKATAIVNGDVITQTDVNQRLALLAIANGGQIPTEELDRLRQQILRNLIDETLQIQAAKAEKIEIKTSDIDRTVARVAANVKQTPQQLEGYLETRGSSIKSLRRQIEGEIAWQRLQSRKIESGVSIGDDEVKAVLDRMTASKGSEEYRVGEIFLSATPATQGEAVANANKILQQLKNGASFAGYARQYSQAIMGRHQRPLLNKETGVYRYDELIVLRKTRMAAVLLEAGSIINRDEELKMSSPERRDVISSGVTAAVKEFCEPRWAMLGPL